MIAVAFIATLIGVMTANVLWLPMAMNLELKDKQEAAHRREAECVESNQIDELALAMHRRRSVA